jgi:hypothetical protein
MATPQEKQKLGTRYVGATKRTLRARFRPILPLSPHYQTGWDVTNGYACHAKRRDVLLGNLQRREVLQLLP